MRPAALMLLAEADALPPILRRLDERDFNVPTVLPGWTVRDVIAHCSGAMSHVVDGTLHRFTPEDNEADVQTRRSWPTGDLIDELVAGYRATAHAIDASGGLLDGLGLGEWVHGGDVREALGRDDAYISAGVEYAIDLIVERSREAEVPNVMVTVGAREVTLGVGVPVGRLTTDVACLVRLVAGRNPDEWSYTITGVAPGDLVLFT